MADARSDSAASGAVMDARTLRLLVPVDGTPQSRWGVKYAVWKHRTGRHVEVSLLHVAEPLLRPWDILRFRTEQEVAQLRAQHAQWLLEDAAARLRSNGVAHQLYFREGEVVSEILNAAEQLGCDEIIVPTSPRGWLRLFQGKTVRKLRRQTAVAVVTVDRKGLPNGGNNVASR